MIRIQILQVDCILIAINSLRIVNQVIAFTTLKTDQFTTISHKFLSTKLLIKYTYTKPAKLTCFYLFPI
jgi:hypothetical protein